MNVGIWGSYKFGNFGDDLMAVGLANSLVRSGHQVSVYGLSRHHVPAGETWSVDDNLEAVVHKCDILVLGGGALLVGYGDTHAVDRLHWAEVEALIDAIERNARRFIAISVGGSGYSDERVPEPIKTLFRSPYFAGGTVRLSSDVTRLAGIGVSVDCFADIVFSLTNLFVSQGTKTRLRKPPYRVGVNLPDRAMTRGFLSAMRFLKLVGVISEVVTIDTYSEASKDGLSAFGKRGELSQAGEAAHLQFDHCDKFLGRLADLDLVVTYKLHVGVAMLSLGGEFVSVGSKEKTKALLRAHSPSSIILSGRSLRRFWSLLRGESVLGMTRDLRESTIVNAEKHIEYLHALLRAKEELL